MRVTCRKFLVEALGREEIVLRRLHEILERDLIPSPEEIPTLIGVSKKRWRTLIRDVPGPHSFT